MSQAPTATPPAPEASRSSPFDSLDQALRSEGPAAAIDELLRRLDERGEHRALLDALLLKARHELGLPLIADGDASNLPEPVRTQFEDRYVEAIRTVGGKILALGDVPGAWPYFRTIGETGPIVQAIEAYVPVEDDPRLASIIDVAFNQGAHPRKGFGMILDHYGTCSAITAFEHLPRDEATRAACADRLVRQLHQQLTTNLRADIAQRGQPLPPEGTSIPGLLKGREWLLADDAYHTDISHLSSIVRMSPLLTDTEAIRLAIELTEYGRKLSSRHSYEGEPPFERIHDDHNIFLRALVGTPADADAAVAHFRSKITTEDPDERSDSTPAQVLVSLLVRLGRNDEAIEVASEHLAGIPESSLFCPGVAQLCQRTGQPGKLARVARDRGDLVYYTAAILQGAATDGRAQS
jgi:hypothetical protein